MPIKSHVKLRPVRSWGLAAWAVAAVLLPSLAAGQALPYNYFGAYSVRGAQGERTDGRISSSRGETPVGEAVGGDAYVRVEADLEPLAFTRALAGGVLGFASGTMNLSYSVVFTPTPASLALASSRASTGQSFGTVTGLYTTEAFGSAYARIVARSESGGFGVDGGRFAQSRTSDCGAPFAVVGPSNNAQCGSRVFAFGLFMEPLPNTLSFVGTVSMFSRAEAGGGQEPSEALAFVDPLVTLDPLLQGSLVVGGGLVANAVPEPAAAMLLLAGLGLLAPRLRAWQPASRQG